MKVAELIARLRELPLSAEIMVLDGFNGGGVPRELKLKPVPHKISQEDIDDSADCDDFNVGDEVFIIMYGCY